MTHHLTWQPLIPGMLIRRYKRFLADVRLENDEIITAHCPNSGSMKACCEPGRRVYLSYHDNPRRKLKYTWELIEMPESLVGVNTLVPNRLVFESVRQGLIDELRGYDEVIREVSIGNHSRIDLVLKKAPSHSQAPVLSRSQAPAWEREGKPCYVEIKNCTLVTDGIAYFPDAVTSRGLKHLVELGKLAVSGCRCVMFYLIQRMDANLFKPAERIDPAYAKELRQSVHAGVEVIVYDVYIDPEKIRLNKKIPYEL